MADITISTERLILRPIKKMMRNLYFDIALMPLQISIRGGFLKPWMML